MSKKTLVTISMAVAVVMIAGFFIMQKKSKMTVNKVQKQAQQSQSQSDNKKQIQDQSRQSNNDQDLKQPTNNDENLIANKEKWNTYTNTADKLSFQYPNSWKVASISPSDLGGKWFSIAPEKAIDNGKLSFTVAIINSKDAPDTWYKNTIENPDTAPDYIGEAKNIIINGDDVYYVKKVSNSNVNGVSYVNYIDQSYIFSNKSSLLLASFRQDYATYITNKEMANAGMTLENEWNYSNYLPDFEYFVNSIKFTK